MSSAATATPADGAAPPKKSKKLLFIIVGVLVLALGGGAGTLWFIKKQAAAAEGEEEEEAPKASKAADPKAPPTFLPMENMVVNLADPGGNRFIQVGLTLQLEDAKTGEAVKAFMPSIRSQVLMLLSQRTADQVLSKDGKDKLAHDITAAISDIMGYEMPEPEEEGDGTKKKKRKKVVHNPVQAVLFSSFIVQ